VTASVASDGADAAPIGDVHRSQSGHGPFDYTFSPDGASVLVQFNDQQVTWLGSALGGAPETLDWGSVTDQPDWQRQP